MNLNMEGKNPPLLREYDIDDFSEDLEIDRLTALAASISNTAIAAISFMNHQRLVLLGQHNTTVTPLYGYTGPKSFLRYTIAQKEIYEVQDAWNDLRFIEIPYVVRTPFIRFYTGIPLIAQDGTILGSLCVLDPTPRKLSEQQKNSLQFLADVIVANLELKTKKTELETEKRKLEANEKRFRNLFELSEGLIGEHDMNGRILSANLATAKSLETSIENLIGRNMREALEPETRNLFDFYLETIAKDGYAEGIMHVKTSTGKSRYWAYKNTKVEDNGYPYVLCSSQDVTELINLEKELRKAEKITKQSVEAKQQFLAKVTHEIRTPMNAIVGFGKLLAKTVLEDRQRKFAEAICTSGDHLLLIVNDLLDTAKIEAGKMTLEEIPFSLQEVVSSVVTILHYKAAEKDLVLSVKIDEDVPDTLIGDPTKLNQVLVNLAGNAVKFTEKGAVTIIIQHSGEEENKVKLKIEVRDTGIGIAQEQLPKLFDSFTQANNDISRKYGGTGLGLTIAKQIIELQNGSVSVESKLGEGTTFSVLLSYPVSTVKNDPTHPEAIVRNIPLGNVRILLAEDNPLNHLLMESILAEWGVEMKVAVNGIKAIECLREEHYDLILMDVHMPEMDGYKASLFIRDNFPEPVSNIPIIAITANSSEEDRIKCLKAGMTDFISKPFQPEELLLKISHYINLKKEMPENPPEPKHTPKTEEKKRVIRLGYLKGVASGNKKFLKEIMSLFISQIPEELVILEKALSEKDWATLADTAHRMKLGINVMGMKESEKMILYIEAEAREKSIPDETSIRVRMEKLRDRCTRAVQEVKELMTEWKL